MRATLLSLCLLILPGCALLHGPDTQRAWVDLQSAADNRLLALELDGSPWTRPYFRLAPGAHQLAVRYRFDVNPRDIGAEAGHRRDCRLTLDYHDFVPGQRYRLQAGQHGFRPWVRLYDPYDRLVARGAEQGCRGG
ncbi:MAG TPA: hypothetical protein VK019_05540 [Pseudomonas sp.]|nr:hypothetical protein [Pseudomonas sp.]